MRLKLHRDKVVSVVRGKDLVGVYIMFPHFKVRDERGVSKRGEYDIELLLAEMSPAKADKIIKIWNNK
jgi:hypothetical protein